TRFSRDWSSDMCSSELQFVQQGLEWPDFDHECFQLGGSLWDCVCGRSDERHFCIADSDRSTGCLNIFSHRCGKSQNAVRLLSDIPFSDYGIERSLSDRRYFQSLRMV